MEGLTTVLETSLQTSQDCYTNPVKCLSNASKSQWGPKNSSSYN